MKIAKYKLPYSDKDIKFMQKQISSIMKNGYLTNGQFVDKFEKEFSKFCNVKYAVAVNDCTAALEIILNSLNDDNRNQVIVPTYTFYATPLSVLNTNNQIVYADINKKTLSLDIESIEKHIGKNTKAIILVHVNGIITDQIIKIKKICNKYKIKLIEDAACAIGSIYKNKMPGNFGYAAAYSFNHSKPLTSGEGGMIVTNNYELAKKARILRTHGIDNSINNWEVILKNGGNHKMTELNAALGLLHLKNAKQIIFERQKIADYYNNNINFNTKIKKFDIPIDSKISYYKYLISVENKNIKNIIMEKMKSKNIQLPPNLYDHLCHNQFIATHTNTLNCKEDFLNSNYMQNHNLCLPMYNGLTKKQLNYIINNLNNIVENL